MIEKDLMELVIEFLFIQHPNHIVACMYAGIVGIKIHNIVIIIVQMDHRQLFILADDDKLER